MSVTKFLYSCLISVLPEHCIFCFLSQALRDEGHDPDEYLFDSSEKKIPKRSSNASKFIQFIVFFHCAGFVAQERWSTYRHFLATMNCTRLRKVLAVKTILSESDKRSLLLCILYAAICLIFRKEIFCKTVHLQYIQRWKVRAVCAYLRATCVLQFKYQSCIVIFRTGEERVYMTKSWTQQLGLLFKYKCKWVDCCLIVGFPFQTLAPPTSGGVAT